MNVYMYELYLVLGIFILFIVINCVIIGCVEVFVFKNLLGILVFDGLMMGVGFILVLVILGGFCEVLGNGMLFYGVDCFFGFIVLDWFVILFSLENFFLLVILLFGVFLGFGFLIVVKNIIDKKLVDKVVVNVLKKVVCVCVIVES